MESNSLNNTMFAAFGDLGGFRYELYQKNSFTEKTEKFWIREKTVYAHSLESKIMLPHFLEIQLIDDKEIQSECIQLCRVRWVFCIGFNCLSYLL